MFQPHVNHPDNTGYNSDPQHIGGDKRRVDLVRFKSTFCKELSIQIETKRLIINKFGTNDIDAWALIEDDSKVWEFVDNKVLTFSEAKSYVLENIESYKIDGFGRYAVRYKPNKN